LIPCQFHTKYLLQKIFIISSSAIAETFIVWGFGQSTSRLAGSYRGLGTSSLGRLFGP